MKLSTLTLAAAALAVAGTAAMADTDVTRTVKVGPNGEVEHVVKRVDRDDLGTKTVHKVKRVETATGVKTIHKVRRVSTHKAPVVVHKKVVYRAPLHHHRHVAVVTHHHHRHYAFTRHGEVHYASSVRPAHNNS